MPIRIHIRNDVQIAEVQAAEVRIASAADGTDLVGSLYFQGFDAVILYAENISPAFFDLKTGIAGEVLQKFSNYRIKLAIVGHFTDVESSSLRDFIRESNALGHINFAATREEALEKLSSGRPS